MKKHGRNLRKSIVGHGAIGALAGYIFLHPASVFIHYVFQEGTINLSLIVVESFSVLHAPMALYFVIVGTVIGVAYGAYSTRLSRLYEEVRRLSLTDSLTSLHNRRSLMERLNEEVHRCQRYNRSLSLIMADIDHFKQYNDTYGHQDGDELLREVAAVLRNHVRKPDFVARYGGEEFVIVMPETDCERALILADRMRAAVKSLDSSGEENQSGKRVTMSLGIAELPTDAVDAESLIREADKALYQAKESGRDRVSLCRERAAEAEGLSM